MKNREDQLQIIREIGQYASDGVVVYSVRETTVVYANAPATMLAGIAASDNDDTITKHFSRIIPEDHDYVYGNFLLLMQQNVSLDVEFRIIHADQTERFICASAYTVLEGDFIVVSLRDTTKSKQHENYLIEYTTKKNTLLDTLTHHMSGAMHLIKNLVDQASKSIADADLSNLKTYLSLVEDNSNFCIEIINDLTKEENDKAPDISIKNTRIDLVEKIGFVFRELTNVFKHRKFAFDTSKAMINITVDEVKLLQVVNNLISNAVKFTPETGIITIRIDDQSEKVIISIIDNGIGIPKSIQPFIFDRRGVARRPGLRGEKSSGLGLSISASLMIVMQGTMWFETIENEGTTFSISLQKLP